MKSGNHHVIKLLLVFEANINSLNSQLSTPLDIAVESKNDAVISLLQSLGAVQGEIAKTRSFSAAIPRLKSFYDTAKMKSLLSQRRMKMKELNAKRGIANGVQARSSGSTLNINGHLHINGMQSSEDKEARTVTITSANGVNGVDGIEMKTDKASEGGTGSCDAPIQCEEDVPTRQRLHSSICRATLRDMEDGNTLSTLYERLQQCINITLDLSGIVPESV